MAKQYKAVLITGPRQSGKTTLARHEFPDKPYVSFENPDTRMLASQDPRSFLSRYPDGAVFDEAQRVPDLFSYLQQLLDESPQKGKFVITGSQHLSLSQAVNQSLSGRVAVLELLPFSYGELSHGNLSTDNLLETLFNGAYPPVFDQHLDVIPWFNNYIDTYIERDVRQILNVRDTIPFRRFVALCAGNAGQLFNATRLAGDCGIASVTAAQWLSVLEGTYLTFRLQPYANNFRKKTVKTPKVYFWDTGLMVRLLGLQTPEQLATHPLRGAVFENWVVSETMKAACNQGERPRLYFWRDSAGLEIDLIQERTGALSAVEIKSGATFSPDWTASLNKWAALAASGNLTTTQTVIYGGDERYTFKGVTVRPWKQTGEK